MAIRSARAEDINTIRSLLTTAGLPVADVLEVSPITFFVSEDNKRVITGCVGLEVYGTVGLLRSLAVTPVARNTGIGHALVETVEEASALHGIQQLYLLTTTAGDFLEHCGYGVLVRDSVPDDLRKSTQFSILCPASAVCMSKGIAK